MSTANAAASALAWLGGSGATAAPAASVSVHNFPEHSAALASLKEATAVNAELREAIKAAEGAVASSALPRPRRGRRTAAPCAARRRPPPCSPRRPTPPTARRRRRAGALVRLVGDAAASLETAATARTEAAAEARAIGWQLRMLPLLAANAASESPGRGTRGGRGGGARGRALRHAARS